MPTLAQLVDALSSRMRAVQTAPGAAGEVHDRPRSVDIEDPRSIGDFVRLVMNDVDGFRGWAFDYRLSGERDRTDSDGKALETGVIEITRRFRFYWTFPFDDAKGSTAEHRQMFEAMATMFRGSRHLGFAAADVKHRLLQGNPPRRPVDLAEGLGAAHLGSADLDVITFESVLTCD